jgi:hypothetical protein
MLSVTGQEKNYLMKLGFRVNKITNFLDSFDGFVLNLDSDVLLSENKFTDFMASCTDIIIHAFKMEKPIWFIGGSIDILRVLHG